MTYSLNTLTDASPPASGSRTGLARFAHETALVLGAVALVFWLLAIASHSSLDPAFSTSGDGGAIRNWGGRLGAWLADGSFFLLGYSVWWCIAAGVRAWLASLARWMRGDDPPPAPNTPASRWLHGRLAFWIGLAVLLTASTALEWSRLYRFEPRLPDHAGGALGYLIGPSAVKWLGFTGSGLFFVALMVPAVFLMGVGPIARWRKASLPELAVRLRWAFAASAITALLLPLAIGGWKPLVSLGLLLAFWIVATTLLNLRDRVKTTSGPSGLLQKLRMQSRSYYGMQLAHVGVAVFIIGVTLVTGFQAEQDVKMQTGDMVSVGGYDFRLKGIKEVDGPNYRAVRGEIEISRGGQALRTMYPEKRSYVASGNAMTETAIDTGIFRDLYISLGEPVGNNAWSVRVHYKPFVSWIWGGAVLMALGGGLAVSDRRYALAARKERLARASSRTETAPALATAATEEP